jgi:hypothetical protein
VTFFFNGDKATGFTAADITVENGALSGLTTSDLGYSYTATFTPLVNTKDTTNVITVANGSYINSVGNVGSGGTSDNYTVDTLSPRVSSIAMSDMKLKVGDTSVVTFTFSKAVTGFDNTDITVENGTLSTVTSSNGGITWTGTFTPTSGIEDTINVITVANSYTDVAGNTGSAGTSLNYEVDTKAPTVAITMSDTDLRRHENSVVTFTFSEAVTGFTLADITVQSGTLSGFGGSGNDWSAFFFPTDLFLDTTNVITVANSYNDVAGNLGSLGLGPNYMVNTVL